MKKIKALFVFLLISSSLHGFEEIHIGEACSYFGDKVPSKVMGFNSDNEAETVIKDIISASGLVQNFKVNAAGVPNAVAVIRGNQRYILYSQHFMHETKVKTGSKWAPISIMAHEIGHHLNGHTLNNHGSRPNLELEADYYSGFILQKLGASLNEARIAMDKIGSAHGTSTHPAKHDRLAAITNGWKKSCESDAECNKPKRKSKTTSIQEPQQPQQDNINIPQVQRRTFNRPQPIGYPSGYQMKLCGCWGPLNSMTAYEQRCQSNSVIAVRCHGMCPRGGNPYGFACQ